MRVVCSYGPLGAGLFRRLVAQISIGSGLFSNPAAIRDLPGVVIRSLPARSAMYPSSINRALCSAGMTAGGSRTAHVLPTVRREANSSGVRGADSDAIIRLCPLTCVGTWSNLLKSANTASEQSGAPAGAAKAVPVKAACFRPPPTVGANARSSPSSSAQPASRSWRPSRCTASASPSPHRRVIKRP